MSFLESIFYMLWRGIAIGVIISAPMGPVGILCIQRTLDKGRKAGFYTGVGAALSDLFYCLLTGFGLSFIEEFLERNSAVIQLIGSVVLIGFAWYLFRKNPARNLRKPVEQSDVSKRTSIITGFFFTFSNPLIIFLIIGLFARFNFLMPEIKFYHYMVGYIFIAAGALGWWWLVTFFIDKVRAHFNLRSMWLLNKIIGGVILVFAIVGIVSAVTDLCGADSASARMRQALPAVPASSVPAPVKVISAGPGVGFEAFGGDSVASDRHPLSLSLDAARLPFVLRMKLDATGKGSWSFALSEASGRSLRFDFTDVEKSDLMSESPWLESVVTLSGGGGPDSLVARGSLPYGHNLSYRTNLLTLQREEGEWSLSAGEHSQKRMLSFSLPGFAADSLSISASPKRKVEVGSLRSEVFTAFPDDAHASPWSDEELLDEYIERSSDPMECMMMVFDRSLEETLLRMGGDYRLACVRAPGGYELIYVSGAVTNASRWHTGMTKARLRPAGPEGVWLVTWFDSEGLPLSADVRAQRDAAGLLTIQFPYQSSQLRLIPIE